MISLCTVIIIMLSTITIKLLTIIIKLYKYAKKKPFYGQVTTNYNVFGLPQIMLVIEHQCFKFLLEHDHDHILEDDEESDKYTKTHT